MSEVPTEFQPRPNRVVAPGAGGPSSLPAAGRWRYGRANALPPAPRTPTAPPWESEPEPWETDTAAAAETHVPPPWETGGATAQTPGSRALPSARPGTSPRPAAVWRGSPGFRAIQTIWLSLVVVEAFIGLRILFLALRAQVSGFVDMVDSVGGAIVAPFRGIVPSHPLRGGGVLEISSIVAMIVYAVAAIIVTMFVRIAAAPRPAQTV